MAIHALGYSTPTDKATAAAEREALWKVCMFLLFCSKPILTHVQALWAGILTSTLAMGFARMSAVFFFRRIFVSTKVDVWDFITKFMITIIALWTLGFCIATVLACGTNVPGVWAPTNTTVCALYPEGKALTMSSFILDFIVLVLPLPKVCGNIRRLANVLTLAIDMETTYLWYSENRPFFSLPHGISVSCSSFRLHLLY